MQKDVVGYHNLKISCYLTFKILKKSSHSKFRGDFVTLNLEANVNIKFSSFFNLKSLLSTLKAIDIENQSLNLKSIDFKFTG